MTVKILLWLACAAMTITATHCTIGMNWGSQMSHPLSPSIVVNMLKANGIGKVKLFDADPWTMSALEGSGLEVMVGIPNYDLKRMSDDYDNAKHWVKENVTRYAHSGGVNIKYVAVGNEPFLSSYNGVYTNIILPAMKNVQKALNDANVGDHIKVVTPINADAYSSSSGSPSSGDFRKDIHGVVIDIVKFLKANGSPFVVNIYPFLSLQLNKDFPFEFAFFGSGGRSINDNGKNYDNVFDANFDTLVWALKKNNFGSMKIIVGEAGWPTDGDKNANATNAQRFYEGFMKKLAAKKGTPMQPGDMEVYLFGLFDEDMKSVLPGNFERHWGIFSYDGRPKFPLDLSGKGRNQYLTAVSGVEYLPSKWCILDPDGSPTNDAIAVALDYACQRADCTPLEADGSCSKIPRSNYVSYALNIFFQRQDQDVRACDFGGIAQISSSNASVPGCKFPIQIISAADKVGLGFGAAAAAVVAVMALL